MAVAASSNSVVDTRSMRIVRLLRVTTYVRSAAAQVLRNAHRRKYDPICIVHPQCKLYDWIPIQWNRQRTGSPLTRVQIYLQRDFTPRDSDVTFDL